MNREMTVQPLPEAGSWLVETRYTLNDSQSLALRLAVQLAHPSPRVSDLERLVIEQALAVLQHTLESLPVRQDK